MPIRGAQSRTPIARSPSAPLMDDKLARLHGSAEVMDEPVWGGGVKAEAHARTEPAALGEKTRRLMLEEQKHLQITSGLAIIGAGINGILSQGE